jgi:hypothetical protein
MSSVIWLVSIYYNVGVIARNQNWWIYSEEERKINEVNCRTLYGQDTVYTYKQRHVRSLTYNEVILHLADIATRITLYGDEDPVRVKALQETGQILFRYSDELDKERI